MFYIISENRSVQPYRPSSKIGPVHAIQSLSETEPIEAHALSNETSSKKGRQNRMPKGYADESLGTESSYPLLVETIMTRSPTTILESASLVDAKNLLKEKSFRHLPVMSDRFSLVGILSHHDLEITTKNRVSDVMTKEVITVDPKATLREVAVVMLHEKIPCLPVLDSTHKLIGIVTTTDILKALLTRASVEIWR